MTPFPVPIHKRLVEIKSAVIRTNENPNFPVPENETRRKKYQFFFFSM